MGTGGCCISVDSSVSMGNVCFSLLNEEMNFGSLSTKSK